MISTISALAALNQGLRYDFCNTQRKHSPTQDSMYTPLSHSSVVSIASRWRRWLLCWFQHARSVASRQRNCDGSIKIVCFPFLHSYLYSAHTASKTFNFRSQQLQQRCCDQGQKIRKGQDTALLLLPSFLPACLGFKIYNHRFTLRKSGGFASHPLLSFSFSDTSFLLAFLLFLSSFKK